MKRFINPAVILGGAAVIAGAALSHPYILMVGAIMAIAGVLLASIRAGIESREEAFEDQVRTEDRIYVRPLRKNLDDIREIIRANPNSTTVQIIGAEAVEESKKLIGQCVELLNSRAKLQSPLRTRTAGSDVDRLRAEIAASSEDDRPALEDSLRVRLEEEEHYKQLSGKVESVEGKLKLAEASIGEMKARLALAASGNESEDPTEDLNDTIGRMRALTTSFDEVEEMLQEKA